jgi:hypothetical protein
MHALISSAAFSEHFLLFGLCSSTAATLDATLLSDSCRFLLLIFDVLLPLDNCVPKFVGLGLDVLRGDPE